MRKVSHGFTLIEVLLAAALSSIVLLVLFGSLQHAVRTRDDATERTRHIVQRQRVAALIQEDLRGVWISGGTLARTFEGGTENPHSHLSGYLCFTTTTGRLDPDNNAADVQQVEYYLIVSTSETSTLVRALTRDLLALTTEAEPEEEILQNIKSLRVTFFDGENWLEQWLQNGALPEAVCFRIEQAAPNERTPAPVPIEVTVTLTTESQ